MPWIHKKGYIIRHYVDNGIWVKNHSHYYGSCGCSLIEDITVNTDKPKCKQCIKCMKEDIEGYADDIKELKEYKEELEKALKE